MKKLTEVFNTIKEKNLSYRVSYQIDMRHDYDKTKQIYISKDHVDKATARKIVVSAEKDIRSNLYRARRIYVSMQTGYGPHTRIFINLSIKLDHGWGETKNL